MLPCVLLQCHVRLAQVGQTRHGGSGVQNLDVILGGDAVQAILETLLSRSSRLSMAKQQDAGNGGEDDGIISADISSLPISSMVTSEIDASRYSNNWTLI